MFCYSRWFPGFLSWSRPTSCRDGWPFWSHSSLFSSTSSTTSQPTRQRLHCHINCHCVTVIVIFFCLSSLSSSSSTVHLVLINIINIVITKFRKVNKRYLIWQDVVNKYFDFQAEGLTAIEIWMLACILFVFGLYSFIFSEKNSHNFHGNVDNGW